MQQKKSKKEQKEKEKNEVKKIKIKIKKRKKRKKKININLGAVSVFAGSGSAAHTDGAGTTASFYHPRGIAVDQKTGTVFVSEWTNCTIRKITLQGIGLLLLLSIS